MIKALIIDDEQKARSILQHYLLTHVPAISEIQLASSADEAVEIMKTFQAGLVFLDVEMPKKNGFDFLIQMQPLNFDVIFTTAYNQYAIQAIRFSALDYLLKPVDPDELIAAVGRYVEKESGATKSAALYENLAANIEKKDIRDFTIAVPASDGTHFFKMEEIIRLEAERNYTMIYLHGKKPFLASKTLKHFEEMLEDAAFIRTHKSHLVNPAFISSISSDKENILLTDGSKAEISRRRKDDVLQQLKLK